MEEKLKQAHKRLTKERERVAELAAQRGRLETELAGLRANNINARMKSFLAGRGIGQGVRSRMREIEDDVADITALEERLIVENVEPVEDEILSFEIEVKAAERGELQEALDDAEKRAADLLRQYGQAEQEIKVLGQRIIAHHRDLELLQSRRRYRVAVQLPIVPSDADLVEIAKAHGGRNANELLTDLREELARADAEKASIEAVTVIQNNTGDYIKLGGICLPEACQEAEEAP